MKKTMLLGRLDCNSNAILDRKVLSKLSGGGVGTFESLACPKEYLLECLIECREIGRVCDTRICSCR